MSKDKNELHVPYADLFKVAADHGWGAVVPGATSKDNLASKQLRDLFHAPPEQSGRLVVGSLVSIASVLHRIEYMLKDLCGEASARVTAEEDRMYRACTLGLDDWLAEARRRHGPCPDKLLGPLRKAAKAAALNSFMRGRWSGYRPYNLFYRPARYYSWPACYAAQTDCVRGWVRATKSADLLAVWSEWMSNRARQSKQKARRPRRR